MKWFKNKYYVTDDDILNYKVKYLNTVFYLNGQLRGFRIAN